jgi:hypothetical protein
LREGVEVTVRGMPGEQETDDGAALDVSRVLPHASET